ncbi:hypothetical protein PWT90_10315 [Aphanocladium album]|nr:hypothetical protein PWT90_10315 [Aphanocladium album]
MRSKVVLLPAAALAFGSPMRDATSPTLAMTEPRQLGSLLGRSPGRGLTWPSATGPYCDDAAGDEGVGKRAGGIVDAATSTTTDDGEEDSHASLRIFGGIFNGLRNIFSSLLGSGHDTHSRNNAGGCRVRENGREIWETRLDNSGVEFLVAKDRVMNFSVQSSGSLSGDQ